jgi:hypothetical protein
MKRLILPLFLLALSVLGCRSGDNGAGSSATEPTTPASETTGALEDSLGGFDAAFQAVSVGLTVAFQQGTQAGEVNQFQNTLLCDTAGPRNEGTSNIKTRVGDNTTDGTFLVESNLKNCSGVNGDLQALGTFARVTGGLTLKWTFGGTIRSGDCEVDLSDLSVSSDARESPAASLVSGTLTATCESGPESATVTCDWNEISPLNPDDLFAGCTCSGSGC